MNRPAILFWCSIIAILCVAQQTWGGDSITVTNGVSGATNRFSMLSRSATGPRDYPLSDLGVLHLTVPLGWRDSTEKQTAQDTAVDVLKFVPSGDTNFVLLVQAIHMKPGEAETFNIKGTLALVAQRELGNSVEMQPEIHDFRGVQASGSYEDLEDQNPKPGEYRYLTLGYASMPRLVLYFRIISHHRVESQQAEALEVIKSARISLAQ